MTYDMLRKIHGWLWNHKYGKVLKHLDEGRLARGLPFFLAINLLLIAAYALFFAYGLHLVRLSVTQPNVPTILGSFLVLGFCYAAVPKLKRRKIDITSDYGMDEVLAVVAKAIGYKRKVRFLPADGEGPFRFRNGRFGKRYVAMGLSTLAVLDPEYVLSLIYREMRQLKNNDLPASIILEFGDGILYSVYLAVHPGRVYVSGEAIMIPFNIVRLALAFVLSLVYIPFLALNWIKRVESELKADIDAARAFDVETSISAEKLEKYIDTIEIPVGKVPAKGTVEYWETLDERYAEARTNRLASENFDETDGATHPSQKRRIEARRAIRHSESLKSSAENVVLLAMLRDVRERIRADGTAPLGKRSVPRFTDECEMPSIENLN